ncbi:PAS domain S-box protein [Chondrinema litorale]|uniref:PAS domain S-box protein n=1 Tax=Chondrinema litorale TaxID=2994555 RepID=UPI002543049A|nr:PAS domain S-box protein [Chondrinema litorale]UZR98255.1 PAS domain S-box protein [Chondrinema litorale]
MSQKKLSAVESEKLMSNFSHSENLLFECLASQIEDAVVLISVNMTNQSYKIVFLNDAFQKLTGYTIHQVEGKCLPFLKGLKTDANSFKELDQAIINLEKCEITTVFYHKNKDEFYCKTKVKPINLNDSDNQKLLLLTFRDVTEIIYKEFHQKLFLQLSNALNGKEPLKKVLKNTLSIINKIGGFQHSEYWLINDDRTEINFYTQLTETNSSKLIYLDEFNKTSLKKGIGIPGLIWLENKTIFCNDKISLGKYIKNTNEHEAIFTLPIIDSGTNQVTGALILATNQPIRTRRFYDLLFYNYSTFLGTRIQRNSIESELYEIYNNVEEIICITGFDGYFKRINSAATAILEYSREELLEIPFIDLIHPDDIESTQQEMIKLNRGAKTYYFENRYISKSGKTIWLSWTSIPILQNEHLFCVARDITEKKKLNKLLDEVLLLTHIGTWEYNLKLGEVYWSNMVRKIHELPFDYEVNVQSITQFYQEGEAYEQVLGYLQESMKAETSWNIEAKIITFVGNEKWIKIIGKSEFIDGVCVRLSGSIQDINERKIAEIDKLEAYKNRAFILENIDEGFIMLDHDWRITFWNNKAEELAGIKKGELINAYFWDQFDENAKKDIFNIYNDAVANLQAKHFEYCLQETNKWYEVSAYPYENGLAIFFKEITERKSYEDRLKISNERFENIADATNDAIWDWDLAANTVYWGKGFKNLFGYNFHNTTTSFEEWIKYIHPEDITQIVTEVEELLEDSALKLFNQEYRYLKSDGNYAYVRDRGMVIRNVNGKAIRMVGAMTDITHHKEYEASLKKLNNELKQQALELTRSNEELEQFAYIASHDLQEPLRMITSFLSQLERKYKNVLDEKGLKYIDFAVDGGKRMRRIILDLLDYSRVGRTEDELEDIDLNDLLDDVKSLFRKSINESSTQINYSKLPTLKSYRSPLTLLFQNLISNAIKYHREDTRPVINISSTKTKAGWEFAVEDNGLGISKEYFDKIFQIFQRLHNREEYSGTGIGLSIVKKIVESLGGRIWLESEEGKGTTFYFTLIQDN